MGGRTGVVGNRRIDAQGDIPVGVVLERGGDRPRLKVEGVTFPSGRYIDIGTPSGPFHGSQGSYPSSEAIVLSPDLGEGEDGTIEVGQHSHD